ncbi:MAG: class I SAM-dependent methyltransferase [Gaiellaceae bacterium]
MSPLAQFAALRGARNGVVPDGAKLRGGYYTPDAIASFLAQWAIRDPAARVLEPSCGDGQLLAAATARLGPDGHAEGIELFEEEAQKAAARAGTRATVVVGDAFSWFDSCSDAFYDACIGNPPFIRYQSFPEEHRVQAFALMAAEGLRPTRLTNAWVPFVVLATRCLRPGGRLSLVLPAELLQVGYAAELREYLVRKFGQLTVVTFKRLVFPGVQQETVLLLGVRGDCDAASMRFIEAESIDDLRLEQVLAAQPVRADLDHAREKWIQYFLSASELALVRELEAADAFTTLGELAEVDVGIVTGRNEFFVLSPSQADALGLRRSCLPLVGRSAQTPGLVLRKSDWASLVEQDSKCLLLQLGEEDRDSLSDAGRAYVEWGERHGVHKGYKCRIRLPNWWRVPSTWVPDAFLLRQIHDGPRIIENKAKATSTDTIHRVRVRPGVDPGALAAASVNSLTFAFSEIRGRSYGGGVLELEPTEAEALPYPKPDPSLSVESVDHLVRRHGTRRALDEVDDALLRGAGLRKSDIRALRTIWERLSARRINRKRR